MLIKSGECAAAPPAYRNVRSRAIELPGVTTSVATRRLPPWHSSWGIRLLIMFVAWMWIQTLWAVRVPDHIDGAILFTKYVVLCAVLYQLLQKERAFTLFTWGHVLGCCLWGWIAFRSHVSGRFEIALEPSVDDSNLLGFHLVTGLAMGGFLFLTSKWVGRLMALMTLPFILNGIILTASRSAMIGLVAAGITALLLAPKGRRIIVIACGTLGIVLLLLLAKDELFWSRAATIDVTDQSEMDASAASRLNIAEANWRMFLDYPFGAGHRGNVALSPAYMPEEMLTNTEQGRSRGAHNTFMAVLVDQGIPGAILIVLLFTWAGVKLFQLRRLDKIGLPPQYGGFRAAIGAGLVAYLAAGQFVNLLKVEVSFWLIALLVVLDVQCARWRAQVAQNTTRTLRP